MYYIIGVDQGNVKHEYISFISKDVNKLSKFISNAGTFSAFSADKLFPNNIKIPKDKLEALLVEKTFGDDSGATELMLPNTISNRNRLKCYIKRWKNL